jgi:hypothetical protein
VIVGLRQPVPYVLPVLPLLPVRPAPPIFVILNFDSIMRLWFVEELTSPLLLRVAGVLDLEPPDARLVRIVEPLRDDALEVVRSHELQ